MSDLSLRMKIWPSLIAGGIGMLVSALMLTSLSDTTGDAWLFTAYVVFGFGFGVINPPITDTAVSGMPAAQAGVAAAVASTSRQVGGSLGVALVGALAVPAATGAAGLTEAGHVGWWIIAGCGAIVVAVGALSTTTWARATAARTALALNPDP